MPLMALNSTLFQAGHPSLREKWAKPGDINYASYLIHFPIPLLLAPMLLMTGLSPTSWLVFMGYLGLVMYSSFIVFDYFEMKIQNYL